MRIMHFIIFLTLLACNPKKQDGWELANQFIEIHSNSFISNKELLKYDYHPRTQFDYNSGLDNLFRAGVKNDSEVIILTDIGLRFLIEDFGLILDLPSGLDVKSISLTNSNNSIRLIANDSVFINVMSYTKNPITHFVNLKNDIDNYKIWTIRNLAIEGMIEVYITATDYLIYFPDNPIIKNERFQKLWDEKMKNGKKINSNWYFYIAKRPLDFG